MLRFLLQFMQSDLHEDFKATEVEVLLWFLDKYTPPHFLRFLGFVPVMCAYAMNLRFTGRCCEERRPCFQSTHHVRGNVSFPELTC